ncbi:hypothetical protein CDAR_222321, partial [Caerostris darwini]
YHLFWVTVIQYADEIAPEGLQSTPEGISLELCISHSVSIEVSCNHGNMVFREAVSQDPPGSLLFECKKHD